MDNDIEHRDFLLKLSPQIGHYLAETYAGFTTPGNDSIEQEIKDSLKLWLQMAASGSSEIVDKLAWWMSKLHEHNSELTPVELYYLYASYVSFAIATVGTLLDHNIIAFVEEPVIPKLVTSTYDPKREMVDNAILERLEATLLKEDTENE
jgi:hypothetical protein